MSHVAEMARAEADAVEAAEAEETTTEPEAAEDSDTEPEAPPVEDKAIKALGRVIETYVNGLKRVMGDDFAVLHECQTCGLVAPGFVLEDPSPLDMFKEAKDKTTCLTCDGYGQLRSGSKTDAALVMCMDCTGNGYVSITVPGSAQQWQPPNGSGQVPPGYLPPSSDAMPTRDQWGRPLGHPHFGMDPASLGL